MTPREIKYWKTGALLCFLLFILSVMSEFIVGWIGIAFTLLFGWVPFLLRVVPQVHWRWAAIGSGAVYAFLLLAGGHAFLRWLYREMRNPISAPAWPMRWTLGGFLILLLMFLSGMATIGAAHQTAWLIHSSEPFLRQHRGREVANRIKCASNLRQIGEALTIYANTHGHQFPDDLSALLPGGDLYSSTLVCPSSNDDPAFGATTQAVAANLTAPHHCSYVFLGKGLSQPTPSDRVIAYEPLEHHQRMGINVLFADMRVEWLDRTQAELLLARLKTPVSATQAAETK